MPLIKGPWLTKAYALAVKEGFLKGLKPWRRPADISHIAGIYQSHYSAGKFTVPGSAY
jgi:hypothetical protein